MNQPSLFLRLFGFLLSPLPSLQLTAIAVHSLNVFLLDVKIE